MAELTPNIRRQVEEGIAMLRRGGIIAYPTDTVYGLGACPDIPGAVERIFQVKGRQETKALPLLLAKPAQINEVAVRVPDVAWQLARRFLPGALTLVLCKSDRVPAVVTGGGQTVAVRVPAHPIPVALVEGLGSPIVGTSANLSGRPSALTADEVREQLGDQIDFIIDGGRCPGGIESTIVDVTRRPLVRRRGAIPIDELRKVVPDIIVEGE